MNQNMSAPRLRPNTFMLLLIRATRSEFGNSPTWGKSSNGLVLSGLFTALIQVVYPAYSPATADTLSQYMSIFLDGSRAYSKTYYPFNTAAFQGAVSLRMEEDYPGALEAMKHLCETYLDMGSPAALRLLVGGILEALIQDDSYPDTLSFHGEQIDKASLAGLEEVALFPFLTDVWTLIVTEHHNSGDAIGTYRSWTADDARSGSPATITTRIGEKAVKKIAVSTALPEEAADTAEDDIQTQSQSQEESAEAVVLKGSDTNRQRDQQSSGTTQNQTLNIGGRQYIQTANVINNFEHVDTVII